MVLGIGPPVFTGMTRWPAQAVLGFSLGGVGGLLHYIIASCILIY
jgi:hypothetical protein